MRDSERICLLGTHIDPAWHSPDGYQSTLENYIEDTDADAFVYLSSPDKNEGDWAYRADEVIMSEIGRIPDSKRDTLLDTYDRFQMFGAYYDACHYSTWDSMLAGIYDEAREKNYEVVFPAHCITEDDMTLEEIITDRQHSSSSLSTNHEPVEEYVQASMEPYTAAAACRADDHDGFAFAFNPEEMTFTWTLESRF